MRRGSGKPEQFAVGDVAERVASYEHVHPEGSADGVFDDELVSKAATLLLVMPPNQSRRTIEALIAPHDPELGGRAVDALIESAFAAEDADGRLRRVA